MKRKFAPPQKEQINSQEEQFNSFKENFTKLDDGEIDHLKYIDEKYRDRAKERRVAESKREELPEEEIMPKLGLDLDLLMESSMNNDMDMDLDVIKINSKSPTENSIQIEEPTSNLGKRIMLALKKENKSNYQSNVIYSFFNNLNAYKKTIKPSKQTEKSIFPTYRKFLLDTLSKANAKYVIRVQNEQKMLNHISQNKENTEDK